MLIKTAKPLKQLITVCFLLCFVMLVSGWSGCGGEDDDNNNNPEGNHTIQITNRLDYGGATKTDIYLDGALRKSNLGYGSTATISGVSNGTHKILVSASPGQGTLLRHLRRNTFILSIVIFSLAVIFGCGGEDDDNGNSNDNPYVDITIRARKADTHDPLVDADVVLQTAGSGVLSKKTDSSGKAVFYNINTGYRKIHVNIQGSDDDPYYGEWLNIDFGATSSRVFDVPRIMP